MSDAEVLVVNTGSSSTKLSLVAADPRYSSTVEPGERPLADALAAMRPRIHDLVAVGHRVVHGGGQFTAPVAIDDHVLAAIAACSDLAPLHNRAAVAGIRVARAEYPGVPHVACFDTAFHSTMPPAAFTYGGPYSWLEQGLRRYGFHGLSHQYAATRAAELLDRHLDGLQLITCHLGGGCSLAAVQFARSVDTTMGLTPVDGLVMATRSGSIDPGLLLHLLRRRGVGVDDLEDTLENRSGLLGLSGVSADVRGVSAARDRGDQRAALALDVFVHRISAGIGAMLAALDGLDAVVFTGGVGEHAPEIRARAVRPFAWLGLTLDERANLDARRDADISGVDASVRTLVVTSHEDVVIAESTRALLS